MWVSVAEPSPETLAKGEMDSSVVGAITAAPAQRSNGTLFEPVKVGELELANRIVMAPCTRCRVDAGGVPTALVADYYVQRATAGLIVSEGIVVSPRGRGFAFTPGLYRAKQVAGWRTVTAAVHRAGGKIVAQLWHTGRISHSQLQPNEALPIAPSAIRAQPPDRQALTESGPQPFETPHALLTEEIGDVVAEFRQAARAAIRAGFDGVEVHAANGYLLDQFHRTCSNNRTDAYGGSAENRARLTLEVIDAVASVCGGGRVGVRISPTNFVNDVRDADPEPLFRYLAAELGWRGLAYLHVVEGDTRRPRAQGQRFDYQALRQLFKGAYMTNNGFDGASAAQAISTGSADLVSFGRHFIANPDLVARLRRGLSLSPADPATFYSGGKRGYTDYASTQD